jgi:protein TonB
MLNKYNIDNPLRFLPMGLFMGIMIWTALIGQLAWRDRLLKPTCVELVELPQTREIIAPKLPVPHVAPVSPRPQQQAIKSSSGTASEVKQTVPASVPSTSSVSTPEPSVAAAGNKGGQDIAPLSVESHSERSAGKPGTDGPAKSSDGPITPPQYGAAYLHNPKPAYPTVARRMRMEGMVMLKVLVSRGGDILKIEMAQSSGYEILDKAAAEAVKNWRFVPARKGDVSVDEWVQVPVAFHLNS